VQDITKLNSRFTFPFKVNLRPYCQETLVLPKGHTPVDAAPASTAAPKPADGKSAEQSSKVAETSSTPTAAAAAVSNALSTALHPDEYYEYVLRGCVVHTGSAHGGHYYSFIQERLEGDQEGKWYEFNDTRYVSCYLSLSLYLFFDSFLRPFTHLCFVVLCCVLQSVSVQPRPTAGGVFRWQ
jgi:hypothetical protein